jgi:sortase A
MVMYRYVKSYPKKPIPRPIIVSYLLMTLGIAVIVWTVWPIVSFFTYDQIMFAQTVSPVDDSSIRPVAPVAYAKDNGSNTDPNTWFPTSPQKKVVAPVNSYSLSIPALGLQGATVVIAGDDLGKSLIHYGGTGLPGEYGNTVIFGHSTLPQLFRGIKDYHAVFATLPTIKNGTDIMINYDGVQYHYVVYDKVVVEPTDLTPLEQRFDDSYLTLVTCVPPGTYLYRLNVKAKLVRI